MSTKPDTAELAKAIPLIEQLRAIPAEAILKINTPNPLGVDTQSIPVGAMCHEAAALLAADDKPVDMLLYCPKCHTQHIDAPDKRTPDWSNPPHKSHLCHGCGHIWRPSDTPTNGIAACVSGKDADTRPQQQAAQAAQPLTKDEVDVTLQAIEHYKERLLEMNEHVGSGITGKIRREAIGNLEGAEQKIAVAVIKKTP